MAILHKRDTHLVYFATHVRIQTL